MEVQRTALTRRTLVCSALAVSVLTPRLAHATHSRDEAKALVDRACAYLQSHGRAAALAVFNDPHGAFRDGDLYLYVLDANDPQLTMLAHGANAAFTGMPQRDIIDADGYDFNAETARVVQAHGDGWITYKWPNPTTHKIAAKQSYVRLFDGVIVGAGIYL